MEEFSVNIYLKLMRENKHLPSQWDFLYLLSKLDKYEEVKWLATEFKKMGKQVTRKMLHFMIYYTSSVNECLEIANDLSRYKVKSLRKMNVESVFSILYIQLIHLSDTRLQADRFFKEANTKGINLGEGHLEHFGDLEKVRRTLESVKKNLGSTKPDYDLESHLLQIDEGKLYDLARASKKEPIYNTVTTKMYSRNPFVSRLAKKMAKGICQLCACPAPFVDKKGEPYLETHHINWLSRGGHDTIENTVALCPNCHKKIHVLDLESDVQILSKRNNYLLRNLHLSGIYS